MAADTSLAPLTAPAAPEPGDGGELSSPESLVFESIYADYVDFVWRTARRLGVRSEALDDVCQEVFVVVHRRLPDFEGRSSVRTWLFGILANVIRAHRRGLRRKSPAHRSRDPLLDPDELVDDGASPHQRVQSREAAALAADFVSQLDEDKRIVFVLAEIEEMPASEIAKCVNANINTVYARLRAARRQFRQMVERHAAQDSWRVG